MRIASRILLLATLLLAGACGIKVDLPSQIPSTEPFSEDDYTLAFQWLVPGVSEMLVGRNTGIFYVIQDQDSLSIYPAYRQTTLVELTGKRLFQGGHPGPEEYERPGQSTHATDIERSGPR